MAANLAPGSWRRLWAVGGGFALAVGLLVLFISSRQEASLLRADPDAAIEDPGVRRSAIAAGRRVFRSNCASCHGQEGRGGNGAPNLSDADWVYGSGRVGEIEQTIAYGVRSQNPKGWNLAMMPAYGSVKPSAAYAIDPLKPGDIRDVVAFLDRLRGDSAFDVASAQRGAVIYAGRGGCYDCHGGDARGDPAIGAPNLVDHVWLYGDGGDESTFRSIAGGRRGVMPAFVGRLSTLKLRQVALYVRSLSQTSKETR